MVARNEYTKSEQKNPVDCSLFYLALRKKTVLQGLWRMASWNREQQATQRLLANNFDDPKWKTAALKNAYALMSKRRFGESRLGLDVGGDLCSCPSAELTMQNKPQHMPLPFSSSPIGFRMPSTSASTSLRTSSSP